VNDCSLTALVQYVNYTMAVASYVLIRLLVIRSLWYMLTATTTVYSDTLSWCWTSEYLLLLLNTYGRHNKHQCNSLYSTEREPIFYRTPGEHPNHYTTDVVYWRL